jgi:uncharacterized protein YjbI with pentapeptide repeats
VAVYVSRDKDVLDYWINDPVESDVQAAVTVIGRDRREDLHAVGTYYRVDLRHANLSGLEMKQMHLEGIDFDGSNLTDAHLTWSCLDGGSFYNALVRASHVQMASLRGASLTGSYWIRSDASGSDMARATFDPIFTMRGQSAPFGLTNLTGAPVDAAPRDCVIPKEPPSR